METSGFVLESIHFIEWLAGGFLSILSLIIFKRFAAIDHRFEKNEGKSNTDTKEIYKKIEVEVKDIKTEQKNYEKENRTIHKELYALTKSMEIQCTRIESKLEVIGRKVCNGNWKDS